MEPKKRNGGYRMVDSWDTQLAEAEQAEWFLQDIHDKASRVPELRQQVADRDRLGRARSVAASSEQQAKAVVDDLRPQLDSWRVSFQDWVREGWRLLADLRTIESKLLPVLDVAVAAAAGLAHAETYRPGDFDERVFMGQSDADQAVDRVLQRLGTGDLGPFDDVPDGFPSDVANVCLQHVGRVFVPRLGRVQFQRRGGVRR